MKISLRNKVEIDGVTKTVKEWQTELNFAFSNLRKKVSEGDCPAAVMLTGRSRQRNQKITATHDGEEKSLTVKEWASLLGVRPESIYQRKLQGMSWEEAVTKPFHKGKTPRLITAQWEGVEYSLSVKDWSKLTGIKTDVIKNRKKQTQVVC